MTEELIKLKTRQMFEEFEAKWNSSPDKKVKLSLNHIATMINNMRIENGKPSTINAALISKWRKGETIPDTINLIYLKKLGFNTNLLFL